MLIKYKNCPTLRAAAQWSHVIHHFCCEVLCFHSVELCSCFFMKLAASSPSSYLGNTVESDLSGCIGDYAARCNCVILRSFGNLVSCVRPPATCSYSDIVQLLLPVVSNTDSFQLVYYNQSVDCNNARLVFDVYIRRRDQSLTPSSRSGQRRRPAFQPRLSPCETPRPAGVRSET